MILFTADLHGNIDQYKKAVSHALAVNASDLIFGGDIAPKGASASVAIDRDLATNCDRASSLIGGQGRFLSCELKQILEPLIGRCSVWIMMGNDDAKENEHILTESDLLVNINCRRFKFKMRRPRSRLCSCANYAVSFERLGEARLNQLPCPVPEAI